jgi:hypothetical protein
MVGTVSRNFHTASRAEILADFLVSGWGTATPVRWQNDYGVDLYCTLTEHDGRLSVVTDYYSLQVKANDDPWLFESEPSVRWLLEYPMPLFLACSNKTKTVLSFYQTLPRFVAGFREPPPERLELIPTTDDEGVVAEWNDGVQFSLSAPILRVSLDDLEDQPKLVRLKSVLRDWARRDSLNRELRRMGLLRFRKPTRYRVNEIPGGSFFEHGVLQPTSEQLTRALKTLFEAVDCVGDQLRALGDRRAALYGALMLHYLQTTRSAALEDDPRWRFSSPLINAIAEALKAKPLAAGEIVYHFAELEALLKTIDAVPTVAKYLAG